jgi:pentatricopeptide repeat protein
LQVMQIMVKEGCQPNVVTYNALMSVLVKNGEWNQTLELFQRLRNSPGLTADTISYSVAISACSKGAKWQKAIELLTDMETAGVKPNEFTYRPVQPRCFISMNHILRPIHHPLADPPSSLPAPS